MVSSDSYFTGKSLTGRMVGIGFKLTAPAELNPNIEDTLIAAAIEGMGGDFRVLSLLTDWFEVHYQRVNVDRLSRALKELNNKRVNAYFSGIGMWLKKDRRFRKIEDLYIGERISLGLNGDYKFLAKRNGEDERFVDGPLLVANGNLRRRIHDIASPEELAKKHGDYFYRVLVGATYRADMIALLKRSKNLRASDLARLTYGSFATAWDVMKDMSIINFPHE